MKTIKKLFFVVLVIAALTSILTINASAASSSCWLENNLVSGDNYYTRSKQTLSVYIRTDYQSETVHLIIKNSSGTVMYNASKDIFKQTYVYHCAFNVDMSKYSYGKYYVYSYVGSSKIDERVFYIGDWKQDSNGWWFKTGNTYLKDTSCYINNEGRYIFNSKGYLTAGWYYNDRTNGWWYFTADGKQVTSGWKSIDGKWYYFNSNNSGNMATGWLQISGKWYYFGNDGAMKTGWQKVNNKWYYFNKDGDMKTGWYKENGKWYYLDASNGDMKTGWAQCGTSYWYYFNADGVLQSGWKKSTVVGIILIQIMIVEWPRV